MTSIVLGKYSLKSVSGFNDSIIDFAIYLINLIYDEKESA